jgi:hypothetical protein
MEGLMFEGPLFIVGMPRSGTKLLRSLLNRNPSIGIPEIESQFLPYWLRHWEAFDDLADPGRFEAFYRRCRGLPYFIYARQQGRMIPLDTWYQACEEFTPAGVFEALMRHDGAAPREEGIVWGDKCPPYLIHVPLLVQLFPRARFIHIVRDVRDHCLSSRKAWGKHIVRAAARWSERIDCFRRDVQQVGARVCEVRYEDLLGEPERELRRVCDFVDVRFVPDMLQLLAPCEAVGDARTRDLVRSNHGKYRTQLTARENRRIESVARGTMARYGYEAAYDGPIARVGDLRLRWYQFLDGINLVRFQAARGGWLKAVQFRWNLYATSANRAG